MKNWILTRKQRTSGAAMIIITMIIALLMMAGMGFMGRSSRFVQMTGLYTDSIDSQLTLEGAYEQAISKLRRGTKVSLSGKLDCAGLGGPSQETFAQLSNSYVTDTNGTTGNLDESLLFLRHFVRSQACSVTNTIDSTHEFAYFDESDSPPAGRTPAFPSQWTDPNPNDNSFFQVRYTFTPLPTRTETNPQQILFEYEYGIEVRAYGSKEFSGSSLADTGVLRLRVSGTPFSQWILFMDSMRNQNGQQLVFAGGNTSAQIQEVYWGPVHVNKQPAFYGHPTFMDNFSTAVPESNWLYYNVANYTSCPTRCPTMASKEILPAEVSMPTEIFNTVRLAAGDTSANAATNNSAVTNTDLVNFLQNHATGTLGAVSSVPSGIYIPVDNTSSKVPTGGIYVEGDVRITLDIARQESDFPVSQWSQLNPAHQTCKFQKLKLDSLVSGVATREVYVADDPCFVTYVFNADNSLEAPSVLNGRLNGNIHVNGRIDELGGASRTRPAIAEDFSMTISAKKDVRIINDIQYEDAEYVTMGSDGNKGTVKVADPWGTSGSPTQSDLAATIADDSKTVLGIISTHRNIMLHASAPPNINLHFAAYAGNSNGFNSSTGLGCGSTTDANKRGCGFGYEAYNTKTGMGTMKWLGGLSEFKDQTTGVLSNPPKGYSGRYVYDTRLKDKITPPAYPVSDKPMVSATIESYRSIRMSKLGD